MLSHPRYSCHPRPSMLLWNLKISHKELSIKLKFSLILSFGVTLTLILAQFSAKLNQFELLLISITQNFDIFKTVDAMLITNRQTEKQTKLITYCLPSRGRKVLFSCFTFRALTFCSWTHCCELD